MAKITDFDELKRRHDRAKIAKVGDKEWIDFATTMLDSFPSIYETAKKMNADKKESDLLLDKANELIEVLYSSGDLLLRNDLLVQEYLQMSCTT